VIATAAVTVAALMSAARVLAIFRNIRFNAVLLCRKRFRHEYSAAV
jgi:hypothetical protein